MSAETPISADIASEPGGLAKAVENQGRTLMVVGGIVAVLGLLAILFPFLSSVTIGLFFGASLVIAGFAHIAHAFSATKWTGSVGEIILALVFLVGGFAMLFNPILALTSLTLLLVTYFVVEGIALLYFALALREQRSWVWGASAAILSFVLAGLLWVGFPATAAWALGLLFGTQLLGTGVSMILIGRSSSMTVTESTMPASRPGAGI